jgi:phospholipid/cholesterol/gamma-HCH transport system permease protein
MPLAREYILGRRSWWRLARFAGFATAAALSPSSYGPGARELAVRQIYLTAWRVLPWYLAFSALMSLVVIEIVRSAMFDYGLGHYALELVLRALILELIPVLTAFFVALRSGSAIGAEVALMRVSGELDESSAGPDSLRSELVPRIAGAALSVFSLTVLSCALAMVISYLSFFHTSTAGLQVFSRVVANVFDDFVLAGFLLKCLLFGLAVALIPLASGLEAERDRLRTVPYAVLAGLVKLFLFIALIEVLALMVKYV